MSSPSKQPASESIFARFVQTVREHPDRIFLIADGGQGEQYTYSRSLKETQTLGAHLAATEFADQEEIGLLSENRPEWAIAYLAILAAGKTVVPIDANLKPNEIAYVIDHANLKTVVTSGRFENQLGGLDSNLRILSFFPDSINYFRGYHQDNPSALPDKINSCAVLIYTSGTTGNPKAVELTHGNILSNLDGITEAIEVHPEDRFLSVLPLHHTFEATCGFLLPLISGAAIVYARSLNSRDIGQDMAQNNITVLIGVPLLFEKMFHSIKRKIDSASTNKRALFSILMTISSAGWKVGLKPGQALFRSMRARAGLDKIRFFCSGGAALPSEVARFFNLLGLTLIQGYGLTETSPVITVQRHEDVRFGSVGPALGNVKIRIDQPSPEGIGEIMTAGPNLTAGYRGNPDETAKLLKGEWLATGDLGEIRSGQLYITGRKKNVIVSAAGKNIYPEELEEKLLASLLIAEVVVFGRKKEGKQGEEVRAIIVPDLEQFGSAHGMSTDKPDLNRIREMISAFVTNVNDEMADFKRLSGFEVQLAELEKTSTKKVKRFLYN